MVSAIDIVVASLFRGYRKIYLGGNSMELEERLAKIEAVIAEDDNVNKWERSVLRWFKFVLFVIAIAGIVIWTASEFASFAVERFAHLHNAIGW